MSAVQICLKCGSNYYTKDYDTPAEVWAALDRGEEVDVFWYVGYGRRFQETLKVPQEEVLFCITEREIP